MHSGSMVLGICVCLLAVAMSCLSGAAVACPDYELTVWREYSTLNCAVGTVRVKAKVLVWGHPPDPGHWISFNAYGDADPCDGYPAGWFEPSSACTNTVTGETDWVTFHPGGVPGPIRIWAQDDDTYDPMQQASCLVTATMPHHEITYLAPAEGTIGGLTPVRVQVKTRCETLVGPTFKEREVTELHPTDWQYHGFQREGEPVTDETGMTTAIYRVAWNTTAVHDGTHDVVIEADFERCYGTTRETINKTFTVQNLSVRTDPPDHITYDGENPPDPITVNITDNDTSDPMTVELQPYYCAEGEDGVHFWGPVITRNVTDASVDIQWNGKDAYDNDAPPGLYTYHVQVHQTDVNPDPAGGTLQVEDSTSYRSTFLELGRALDENQNPIYEVEEDEYKENDPDNEEDDEYSYIIRWYTLLDVAYPARHAHSGTLDLYNPSMEKKATWDVATLPCAEHGEQTDGLHVPEVPEPGMFPPPLKHGVRVAVLASLMDEGGTYRFVLHLEDDHPADYRDHRRRPPLDLNSKKTLLPIEYFSTGGYHVAWCRRRFISTISKYTHRLSPAEPHAPRDWAYNATGPGTICSAVNGGFFHPKRYDGGDDVYLLHEMGNGTAGSGEWYKNPDWHVIDDQRWCFGMTERGKTFGLALMEKATGWKGKSKYKGYAVASRIESSYPYGLSNVGKLVSKGTKQAPEDSKWQADSATDTERTALGWTAAGDFFLVGGAEATWDEVGTFFTTTLPAYVSNHYKQSVAISTAVMLDGGGSTEFAYRRKNSKGASTKSDLGAPRTDGRHIPDIVAASTLCKD